MLLSICIPTYNREKYIGETLRSIFDQIEDDVEVVVCDNASQDGTQAVVEKAFEGRRHVRYFRWAANMGADRNFLKVVELASGDYCWFMGSDDIVEPGAVAHVLEAIRKYRPITGASVNFHAYSVDLKERMWVRPMANGALPTDRLLCDVDETVALLGAYFGYLPGQIVNRAAWNEIVAECDLTPYLNAYVHVFVIFRMLQKQPRWLYLSRRCVGWRSGNDSFLSEGRYKRLAIDVIGYDKIAGDVFGYHSRPYRDLQRTVATVHVKSSLFGAKSLGTPIGFYLRAAKLCIATYWRIPAFWVKTFPVFLMPRFAYVGLRAIYRSTLKISRSRRANAA